MNIHTYKNLGHWGALGNQLWQIAGTIGEAKRTNSRFIFPEWEYQSLFSIEHYYFDQSINKDTHLGDGWIDGGENYFQDLSYWYDDYEWLIRAYFQPSDLAIFCLSSHLSNPTESIGVHVRRGNNVFLPNHHPVQDISYYEEAIDILKRKTGLNNLLVFTDDKKWCMDHSLFKDAEYGFGIPSNVDIMSLTSLDPKPIQTAALDMFLMTMCPALVMSNSTLSWWGAFLNISEDIIYPSKWYGNEVEADQSLMFRKEWRWGCL